MLSCARFRRIFPLFAHGQLPRRRGEAAKPVGEISHMMKKKALCLGLLSIAWPLSSCVTTVGGESSGSSEVYAIYTCNEYSVSFVDEKLHTHLDALAVEYSKSYTLPSIVAPEGWTFVGWKKSDGGDLDSANGYRVLGGITLFASWAANSSTITLDAGNGTLGEGVEGTLSLTLGSSYNLPIPKNALEHSVGKATFTSYSFLGWYLDDEKVASSGTSWDYASSTRTLVAKYEAKEVYYGYYPQSHVGDTA